MVYVDIKKLKIHPNISLAGPGLIKELKKYLERAEINVLRYCQLNPPDVFIRGSDVQLISRHHIYVLTKELKEKGFNAIAAANKGDLKDILKSDKVNTVMLETALLGERKLCDAANTHGKRRMAKQTCPLCGGPLARQKGKNGEVIDGVEMFEVHCHYGPKCYPQKGCKFSILLEKPEFDMFKKNMYPTSQWLVKKGKCSTCNESPLFQRKTLSGKVFERCLNTLIDNLSVCDWHVEIKT